jgi:lantibiotic modifying enzyme
VPLTGLSHGAAGFGYALGALSKASGIDSFADAARDCIAYEDDRFCAQRSNWPDLRDDAETPAWPSQWCHGGAGIGLARLGMLRFGAAGLDLRRDIEAAIVSAQRAWPSPIDGLCCGNAGSAVFLAEAGRMIDRRDLTTLSAMRLQGVLDAVEARGGFAWQAGGDDENLGFFRGLAGIGYTLLRHVAPESLPNVLIWE